MNLFFFKITEDDPPQSPNPIIQTNVYEIYSFKVKRKSTSLMHPKHFLLSILEFLMSHASRVIHVYMFLT